MKAQNIAKENEPCSHSAHFPRLFFFAPKSIKIHLGAFSSWYRSSKKRGARFAQPEQLEVTSSERSAGGLAPRFILAFFFSQQANERGF